MSWVFQFPRCFLAGEIAGKLTGKILDVFVMYRVGICMVHCPFPYNILVMYWLGTLVLAPSEYAWRDMAPS